QADAPAPAKKRSKKSKAVVQDAPEVPPAPILDAPHPAPILEAPPAPVVEAPPAPVAEPVVAPSAPASPSDDDDTVLPSGNPDIDSLLNSVLPILDAAGRTAYPCPHPTCRKLFTRRYNLQSHLRCHSGERPFVCPHPRCRASFSRKHDLRRHTRSLHSEDRPHLCRWCGLSFARSDALKRHLSSEAKRAAGVGGGAPNPHPTVFDPADWEEEHCVRRKSGSGEAGRTEEGESSGGEGVAGEEEEEERDEIEDDGEPVMAGLTTAPIPIAPMPSNGSPTTPSGPVSPSHADAVALATAALAATITPSPTGGFPCPQCPTTFSRKHDLLRHIRSLHTWHRPYQCRHCGLCFSRSDALKRHLASEAKKALLGGGDARNPHPTRFDPDTWDVEHEAAIAAAGWGGPKGVKGVHVGPGMRKRRRPAATLENPFPAGGASTPPGDQPASPVSDGAAVNPVTPESLHPPAVAATGAPPPRMELPSPVGIAAIVAAAEAVAEEEGEGMMKGPRLVAPLSQ
ncbi:hypothetical protein HDU96_002002, partial [Phlyctochytrium bullatum]